MTRWFVVTERKQYPGETDISEEQCWTISREEGVSGWENDGGYIGYGLTKADAEELANAANAAWALRNG
jgi:hypothetical protein